MDLIMNGGVTTINGKTYKGNNICIRGNEVIVDGVVQEDTIEEKNIYVTVEGDVESLSVTSGSVITTSATNISTTSGDINCGDVKGSISTISGDVNCESVTGGVNTISGDIIKG